MHPATPPPPARGRARPPYPPPGGACCAACSPRRSPYRWCSAPPPAATTTAGGRPERAGQALHLLVGRRGPGQADRGGARPLHQEAPERHVQEDLAGQPGLLRQAGHPDRRRRRAGHLPDRRQLPGRVRGPQRHARPDARTRTSGKLDMSKFPESLWQYGVVDGKLAGVAVRREHPGPGLQQDAADQASACPSRPPAELGGAIAWAEQVDRRPTARCPAPWTRAPTTRRSGSGCASRARTSTRARSSASPSEDVTKWFELWKGARDAQGHPDRRRHPRGQRQRHHQAARGHRQGRAPPGCGPTRCRS